MTDLGGMLLKNDSGFQGRMGHILVSDPLVESENSELWKVFALLKFIPLSVTREPGRYRYTGTSPEFTEIYEGCAIPTYNPTITTKDGVIVSVTV